MSTINRTDAARYYEPTPSDSGAAKALSALPPQGPISGEQFFTAIHEGTKDQDGQAAGLEFNQIKEFALKNWDRLSPEARKLFELYERAATQSLQGGTTGISNEKYDKLINDLRTELERSSRNNGPKDASATQALAALPEHGPVSGEQLFTAIHNGTRDRDGQAAGLEFSQIKEWALQNWDRLTPEARTIFKTYERAATESLKGQTTGISNEKYEKLIGDLRAELDKNRPPVAHPPSHPIHSHDPVPVYVPPPQPRAAGLPRDPGDGTGPEFPNRPGNPFAPTTRPVDASTAQALASLDAHEAVEASRDYYLLGGKGVSSVSGPELANTIIKAVEDTDGQAAGVEYHDIKNWADKNRDNLSPAAQRVLAVYDEYAKRAQAEGRTGLTPDEFANLKRDLATAAQPTIKEQILAAASNDVRFRG